ncbi:MAG: hypothetical protein JF603_06205 [Acidobacteria bacterium]|nr:hypothetical protein [Acidobacteriota bacterium]
MWFTRKTTPAIALRDELACTGTLILHADGTNECEHRHLCEGDELVHAHVVGCDELACACTGEEWVLAA